MLDCLTVVVTSRGVVDDASSEKVGNLSLNFKLPLKAHMPGNRPILRSILSLKGLRVAAFKVRVLLKTLRDSLHTAIILIWDSRER